MRKLFLTLLLLFALFVLLNAYAGVASDRDTVDIQMVDTANS